jgi:hypothetical protein
MAEHFEDFAHGLRVDGEHLAVEREGQHGRARHRRPA